MKKISLNPRQLQPERYFFKRSRDLRLLLPDLIQPFHADTFNLCNPENSFKKICKLICIF